MAYKLKKGYKIEHLNLLGTNNWKTIKSQALSYLTGILYLVPAFLAGSYAVKSKLAQYDPAIVQGKRISVCPSATSACLKSCLFISGARVIFKRIIQASTRKTKLLISDYDLFFEYLYADIAKIIRLGAKRGFKACIRLNGTSDIAFENLPFQASHQHFGWHRNIMTAFPDIRFYDYTKRYDRMIAFCEGKMPDNYYLTFSHTEHNRDQCLDILARGGNVAVPFRWPFENLGSFYSVPIISGEKNDLRFLDEKPRIIGLLAKARAKHDTSGFVINNPKEG